MRGRQGFGRFVPAWLPSLEWWAIAAMRAPMRPSGGDRVVARYPLCIEYALSQLVEERVWLVAR